jgi:hypothetical protein
LVERGLPREDKDEVRARTAYEAVLGRNREKLALALTWYAPALFARRSAWVDDSLGN